MSCMRYNMKAKTKKRILIPIIIVAVLLGISYHAYCSFCFLESMSYTNHRMFGDLSDFDRFGPYEVRDIKERINNETIKTDESYTKALKWEGRTYRVYCYKFADERSTYRYLLKNGENPYGFHAKNGFSTNDIITHYYVYSGRYCIRIDGGPPFVFFRFLDWFMQDFPTKVSVKRTEVLKSDFDNLKTGQSLDDVREIDPDGEYLFLETGRNDTPKVSSHYTKDGYFITVEYDDANVIISINEERI